MLKVNYNLESGTYRRQQGEPYWMPEVGLGIGRYDGEVGGVPMEILTWYDAGGNRHFSEAERERYRAERAQLEAAQERQRGEALEVFLRSQGFDPDNLPGRS